MAKKKEQVDVEQLREELLICRKNGYQKLSDDRVKKADAFCEDYKEMCIRDRACISCLE